MHALGRLKCIWTAEPDPQHGSCNNAGAVYQKWKKLQTDNIHIHIKYIKHTDQAFGPRGKFV